MRALIQRVKKASVTTGNKVLGSVNTGLLVLLGIAEEDDSKDISYLIDKILHLRVFPNKEGKFDKSITDINGEILVVSQFTLYGSTKKGRRPDFNAAAKPEKARALYEEFMSELRKSFSKVSEGQFAAMMEVSLINDGPVTLMIDSRE